MKYLGKQFMTIYCTFLLLSRSVFSYFYTDYLTCSKLLPDIVVKLKCKHNDCVLILVCQVHDLLFE